MESVTAHLGSEQYEILKYILRRHNTTRMLMRRSGLIERRVQRRLRELLISKYRCPIADPALLLAILAP